MRKKNAVQIVQLLHCIDIAFHSLNQWHLESLGTSGLKPSLDTSIRSDSLNRRIDAGAVGEEGLDSGLRAEVLLLPLGSTLSSLRVL